MITIKELKIKNFLSHQNTELSLSEKSKLLIDGKSGSGKSSIIDAIIWVLYGKSRTDNRNIIKRGEKEAKVTLILSTNNKEIKIERKVDLKGKNNLILEEKEKKDWIQIKVEGLKNKQAWIENELLHSSYLLFINSIAYPQDNIENFIKQPANKRKELLLEIANVTNLAGYYDKAKESISLKGEKESYLKAIIDQNNILIKEYEKEALKLEEREAQKKKIKEELEIVNKKIEEIKIKKSSRDELSNKKRVLEKELELLQGTKIEIEQKIEENNKKIELKNDVDIEEINRKIEELKEVRKELSNIYKKRDESLEWQNKYNSILADKPLGGDFDGEIDKLNKEIENIVKKNNTYCEFIKRECPTLEHQVKNQTKYYEDILAQKIEDKKSYEEKEKIFKNKLESLGTKPSYSLSVLEMLTTEEEKLKLFEEKKSEYEIIESQQSIYKEDIKTQEKKKEEILIREKEIKDELLEIDKNLLEYKNIDEEDYSTNSLFQTMSSESFKLDALITQSKSAKENIEKTKEDNKDKIKEYKKIKSDKEDLLLIKDAFSPTGIKAIVIDYLIPTLEERINNILSQLSDFKIQLETQKKNLSDSVTEGLFINIYNEHGECFDFENYSGGEKLKIIVSISEALSELQKIGFRIIDELFIGLDEDSTENFSEIIEKLQDRFSQIFCISHLRQIKDNFSNIITVTKNNETSIIN